MNNFFKVSAIVAVFLFGFIANSMGFYAFYAVKTQQQELAQKVEVLMKISSQPQTLQPLIMPESSWIEVQKKTKDTVIQIFSQSFGFNWLEPYRAPEQQESTGSGFFINDQGHFLTNYHVVNQAKHIQIQIPTLGQERLDAEVIGVSPERDIALLKVTDEAAARIRSVLGKIPFLPFGDSDLIKRGQEILALGYPLGQEHLKSTQGIVSGRERVPLINQLCLQMTAPLNPGNSGGPSINPAGEVIGINFAGIQVAQNVGYVIPISDAIKAIQDLYKVTFLRKPVLGALFEPSNTDMARYLNNPPGGGYYIARVLKNSMLEKAGMKDGDVLYRINGFWLDHFGEMAVPWSEDKISIIDILNRFVVGDKITFKVYRKGKALDITFSLEPRYVLPIRAMYPEYETIDYEVIGGMVVMELSLNHLRVLLEHCPSAANLLKYTAPENQYDPALIITHVLATSPVCKLRGLIGPGMLIEEINDQKVKTLAEFREAVKKSKQSGFLTMLTQEKRFVVLSVESIAKEEERLSKLFLYQKSKLLDGIKLEVKPVAQEVIVQPKVIEKLTIKPELALAQENLQSIKKTVDVAPKTTDELDDIEQIILPEEAE